MMMQLSPRMTLSLWYVGIISLVAIVFASLLFQVVSRGFQERSRMVETRIKKSFNRNQLPRELADRLREDEFNARDLLLLRLIGITCLVVVLSSGASYILAGKSLKPLEHALATQKRFVADTSHELKTPIAALRTHLEVSLKEKSLSKKRYHMVLSDALDAVVEMQGMIEHMLTLSQQHTVQTQKKEVVLKPVLRKVISQVRRQYAEKSLVFTTKIDAEKVMSNKEQLQLLLTVLIENAAKYSRNNDSIVISSVGEKQHTCIRVSDTGVGIAEQDIPHVFDRFYRSDTVRTRSQSSGQGLGLAIAQHIVDDHGGKIEVSSTLGEGTEVVVKIPV